MEHLESSKILLSVLKFETTQTILRIQKKIEVYSKDAKDQITSFQGSRIHDGKWKYHTIDVKLKKNMW